ncbi:hypothetical protein SUGI_0928200 [Cryptomeria japonica]|uniref:CST complex subunit TEN1 n=1 Tax=Cryptomeria japonica TaxID=3369 RepID=UPI0024147DFE|nr:CST complex subunit TEN1 [Cryptomeria japonica]GLJ44329.1 hypothetical protein SUGI_0928200 [Cryptomeria japonica]
MAASSLQAGVLATIQELRPSSPLFTNGASLRITGRLQEFSVETAVAVIADEGATFRIDTQNLRDINFRIGSLYQFIGELFIQPDLPPDQAILQARVGRNVDGMDINLYRNSLELRRRFEEKYISTNSI